MPPASEICGRCHVSTRDYGVVVRTLREYADDEPNTESATVLQMQVGGPGRPTPAGRAIHWHADPSVRIEYIATDADRQTIPYVKVTDRQGAVREFTTEGTTAEQLSAGERRVMDCVDCHNQPSHRFDEPEAALDRAIAAGLVSRKLPFVRKVGLELLHGMWTRDTARARIEERLQAYYRDEVKLAEADAPLVAAAAGALADIWLRNIHPAMNITWGTYPSLTGHLGCMRCHDGEHFDADGNEISTSCDTCHVMLADREQSPDILQKLGLTDD